MPVRRSRRPPANPLESLSLDIGRLMDRNLAAEMWDRYQRGESKAFTKRLYTPAGQKAFDEVARKYRADRNFKQTVDRYITEFERLLDEVAREDRAPRRCAGTSPPRPAWSIRCWRMPQDGWDNSGLRIANKKTEAAMPPFSFGSIAAPSGGVASAVGGLARGRAIQSHRGEQPQHLQARRDVRHRGARIERCFIEFVDRPSARADKNSRKIIRSAKPSMCGNSAGATDPAVPRRPDACCVSRASTTGCATRSSR